MGFNASFVVAAVIAALLLPPTGLSVVGLAVMAVVWFVLAGAFAALSRAIGADSFEKGTEDLTGRAAGSPSGVTPGGH